MGKWTPGPWILVDGDIRGANNEPVCWGYHEDFGMLCEEIKPANARLIAAAPEMDQALMDAPRPLSLHSTAEEALDWRLEYERWYKITRARVLGKAEGK